MLLAVGRGGVARHRVLGDPRADAHVAGARQAQADRSVAPAQDEADVGPMTRMADGPEFLDTLPLPADR